jgi:hypothetical protein
MMLENPGFAENPTLLPNQLAGAFSRANLMAYGIATTGVAVGYITADFVDRYVATMKPKDAASGAKANNPWYGKDAAAAQRMRPGAWRLGAQAIGAVVALGLAYATRGQRLLPWFLGGTAIGFGVNLLKMLSDWWLMPTIFKVKDSTEISFSNRMFPMEQTDIQNQVADIFANWDKTAALNDGQAANLTATVSPLNTPGSSDVYTLGRQQMLAAPRGGRFFKNTGRLGNCPNCGGYNGCWNDCPTQCDQCPEYNPNKKCTYTVLATDDMPRFYALISQSGVTAQDVVAMNGGVAIETLWVPGQTIMLPYGMCSILQSQPAQPVPPGYGTTVVSPVAPRPLYTIPTVGPGPNQLPVTATYTPPVVAGVPAEQQQQQAAPPPNGNGAARVAKVNPYRVGVTDDPI